jgi:hypothetical protein
MWGELVGRPESVTLVHRASMGFAQVCSALQVQRAPASAVARGNR